MSRVRTSFWLDGKRSDGGAGAQQVPGRVVGPGENGTLRVEVGQSGNVVNVPSGGGAFATGSEVNVTLGADGAPSGVLDATGAFERGGTVYAGAEGREIREASERSTAAAQTASRVSEELRAAHEDAMGKLQQLKENLAAAQSGLDAAKLMYTQGTEPPTTRYRPGTNVPVGAVYERVDGQGNAIGRYRWDGSSWKDFKPTPGEVEVTKELWARLVRVAGDATIGGRLLVGESVTADKLVASKELSAKVARFEESVVSKLKAQKAVITGDLIAEKLVGKQIEGGVFRLDTVGGGKGYRLDITAASDGPPIINFMEKNQRGETSSVMVMGALGMNVFRGVRGERPYFVSWAEMAASPYFRHAPGLVDVTMETGHMVRAPLGPDSSTRGRQVRVINGNTAVVPESGRYRVSGWACFLSDTWDASTEVALLRGDASEADWGDLYGYAIAPVGSYSTPSFSGLVDIKAGERVALGLKSSGRSTARDYRFEIEFVCPL